MKGHQAPGGLRSDQPPVRVWSDADDQGRVLVLIANDGPIDTFTAHVGSCQGTTTDLPANYALRWQHSATATQEISAGASWRLDVLEFVKEVDEWRIKVHGVFEDKTLTPRLALNRNGVRIYAPLEMTLAITSVSTGRVVRHVLTVTAYSVDDKPVEITSHVVARI